MSKFKMPREEAFLKKIGLAILLLVILILVGTVTIYPIKGNISDSLVEAASRITRVPVAGDNAIFFFLLALFGYVLAFYIVYVFIEFSLEGKINDVFKGVRMEKKITLRHVPPSTVTNCSFSSGAVIKAVHK